MATAKDWLTWEIREEYEEDKIIGNAIGELKMLRETCRRLRKLNYLRPYSSQLPNELTESEERKLLQKEVDILAQLANSIKGLMTVINRTREFERAYTTAKRFARPASRSPYSK